MNWPARFAVVAGALAVTLPSKWAAAPMPHTMDAESRSQALALKSFLDARQVRNAAEFTPEPALAYWTGWRFNLDGCRAAAVPDLAGAEVNRMLSGVTDGATRLNYVYRGRIASDYDHARTIGDRLVERMLEPWRRSRAPMVVVLVLSGDCDQVLRWDWSRL